MKTQEKKGFSFFELEQQTKRKKKRKYLNQSVRVMLNSEQKYKLLLQAEQQSTTISKVIRNLINQYL